MKSPWEPIASAPKDGTNIVYMDDGQSLGHCHFSGEVWWDDEADQICYPVLWVAAPLTEDMHKPVVAVPY